MKIKNISDGLLILAGVKIYSGEIKNFEDFGFDFDFSLYKDEFMNALDNNKIEFLSDEDAVIEDTNVILQKLESTSSSTSSTVIYNDKDFYYDYKELTLDFGESIDIGFVGYLKTLDFYVKSGGIDVQVVQPLMNKIAVLETNNYVIDCDYKLQDPTIRLTALEKSTCKLYLDGIFKSETKTKEQYLTEIYSYNTFPKANVIQENSILFKTNFMKTMTSEHFLDIIGSNVGLTYNNATLKNFNRFEDGAYCKFGDVIRLAETAEYTFNMWYNFHGDTTNKQYIMYKKDVMEIYVQNGMLNFYVGRSGRYQIPVDSYSWQMLTITKSGYNYNVYQNTDLVKSFTNSCSYQTNSKYAYFGGYGHYYMRSGELGEVAHYNYHFSAGMVQHLFQNNHPLMQTQTNIISGSIVNDYSYTSSLGLDNAYEFAILEKESAKASNIVSSSKDTDLNGSASEDNLRIVTAKVYFPSDAIYDFSYTGTGKWNLTINDKAILTNEVQARYFMEEGYYSLKLVTTGEYDLTYKLKSDVNYSPIEVFIDDSDDTSSSEDENSVYFDIDNKISSYGLSFNNFPNDLKFEEHNAHISNITDEINSGIYTISFNLQHKHNTAMILGQGKSQWEPNFEINITNSILVFKYQDTYIEGGVLCKNKEYNIQITSNSSSIFIYVDGDLVNSTNVIKGWELDSTDNLYIGSMANNYLPKWSEGEFKISNFKWYNKYFTKDEVINNYINNKVV